MPKIRDLTKKEIEQMKKRNEKLRRGLDHTTTGLGDKSLQRFMERHRIVPFL